MAEEPLRMHYLLPGLVHLHTVDDNASTPALAPCPCVPHLHLTFLWRVHVAVFSMAHRQQRCWSFGCTVECI